MKAVKVIEYHKNLEMGEAEQPKADGPLDVVVKIGAAGVCRTDIHILEGMHMLLLLAVAANPSPTQGNGKRRQE